MIFKPSLFSSLWLFQGLQTKGINTLLELHGYSGDIQHSVLLSERSRPAGLFLGVIAFTTRGNCWDWNAPIYKHNTRFGDLKYSELANTTQYHILEGIRMLESG